MQQPKNEDFYHAEGEERVRLDRATRRILHIADDMDLDLNEMLNILNNLLAEIAFAECIDRETIVGILGKTYDLHVADSIKSETIN